MLEFLSKKFWAPDSKKTESKSHPSLLQLLTNISLDLRAQYPIKIEFKGLPQNHAQLLPGVFITSLPPKYAAAEENPPVYGRVAVELAIELTDMLNSGVSLSNLGTLFSQSKRQRLGQLGGYLLQYGTEPHHDQLNACLIPPTRGALPVVVDAESLVLAEAVYARKDEFLREMTKEKLENMGVLLQLIVWLSGENPKGLSDRMSQQAPKLFEELKRRIDSYKFRDQRNTLQAWSRATKSNARRAYEKLTFPTEEFNSRCLAVSLELQQATTSSDKTELLAFAQEVSQLKALLQSHIAQRKELIVSFEREFKGQPETLHYYQYNPSCKSHMMCEEYEILAPIQEILNTANREITEFSSDPLYMEEVLAYERRLTTLGVECPSVTPKTQSFADEPLAETKRGPSYHGINTQLSSHPTVPKQTAAARHTETPDTSASFSYTTTSQQPQPPNPQEVIPPSQTPAALYINLL